MIIQWGETRQPSGYTTNFIYPISFQSWGIPIAIANVVDTDFTDYIRGNLWQYQSLSGCWFRTTGEYGPSAYVIAIGY